MKRILITGASRGIGRAVTEKLAAPDAELLLHGRDNAALAEVCRLVQSKSGKVVKLSFDLATKSGVCQLIDAVGSAPLDVLINNAGVAVVKPFTEVTEVEWDQTIGVNVTAPFMLIQHFAPRMKPGSTIVNILSIAAKHAYRNWSVYCASKFALDGLSMAIREELREHKVRMINVYPAATDTNIWDAVSGEWPREKMMPPAQVADAVAFAISQPPGVSVDNIMLSNTAGAL
jgi:NAD(P)-dependent dehydrogenase (short-subunit alcohol dehydrogenase family)